MASDGGAGRRQPRAGQPAQVTPGRAAVQTSYEQGWASRYYDLTPVNQYNVDYSVLGINRAEDLLGAIRLGMEGAGLYVESVRASATSASTRSPSGTPTR